MKFLENVVQDLISNGYNLSNLAMVLPSRRAGLFLKKHIQDNPEIKKPIFSPDIYSIKDFFNEIMQKNLLSRLQLIFELYEAYLEVFDDIKDFDEFYNWGNIVLNDFQNIDKYLVDYESLFRNLKELTEIKEEFDTDTTNQVLDNFRDLSLKIKELYEKYTRQLDSKNQVYYGKAIRMIAENFDSYKKRFQQWDKIFFVGFNAFTKAEELIVEKLKEINMAELYWDVDRYFYKNPNHEAGKFFRDSKLVDDESKWIDDKLAKDKKNIKIIGCSKKVIQSKILGNMIDSDRENNNNTAIILPDESMLFPLLHSLPKKLKKFNVTMGFPLRHTSLYNLISFMVDMHENKNRLEKDKFYYEDVTNILTHPYMLIIAEKNVVEFVNNLKQENKVFVNKNEIKQYFNNEVTSFFEENYEVDGFIAYLKNCFDIIRKNLKNEKGYTIELEYLYQFYLILQKLQDQLENFDFNISINSFWKLFKEIVDTSNIPFTGEPLQGLQIMGMLETRTLDFDNIYILSMNEGVIPQSKSDNSIIPYELKKNFGIPTYKNREGIYAYYFYRLLKRAKNITLFYNTEKDSLGKGEKSRFIEQLLLEYSEKNVNSCVEENILTINTHMEKDKSIEVEKTPGMLRKMKEINFSASAINTYLDCSLKFYFKYILNLQKKDEFLESVDSQKFGLIVHNTLENVYTDKINKKLNSNDYKEMKKLVNSIVEDVYKDEMGDVNIKKGRNLIYSRIIKELVTKVIDNENEGLRILATEKKYRCLYKLNDSSLKLKGFIDRIDKRRDGVLRIIDYKTGSINSTVFDITKDYSREDLIDILSSKKEVVQLLIYFYLIVKSQDFDVSSGFLTGILSLRNLNSGIKYLKKGRFKDYYFDKSDIRRVKDILDMLFKNIFDPDNNFAQTDDDQSCEYCDFSDICVR